MMKHKTCFILCLPPPCYQYAKAAAEKGCVFLTAAEEELVCQYYMKKLLEFCSLFTPLVPRSALVSECFIYIYCSSCESSTGDGLLTVCVPCRPPQQPT